jgi:hypothetical protein
MAHFEHGDDLYEIMRGGTPEGAMIELNAVAGRYSQLPQPLLEAIWRDDVMTFILYACEIELPFEIVEQLVHEARRWLPPQANSEAA